MKAFLIALVVGVLSGVVAVKAGYAPGNFAYGKVVPFIFTGASIGGFCLAWFPLELLFRRIEREKFDRTLLVCAALFCLCLFAVGFWAVGRYSNRIEIQRITAGSLNTNEQMAIIARYQSHFGRGDGSEHDWHALMELARSPATNPKVLRAIAADSRLNAFTEFLGRNPSTPNDILEEYAKDRNRAFYLKDNPKWKARVVAGEDWRIDIFDRAQALVAAQNRKFRTLLVEAEPRLADWCSRTAAWNESKQKASRYAFVKLLREKPEEITSDKPADWVRILDGKQAPAVQILRADPIFVKIYGDYEEKRKTSGGLNPPIELFEPVQEKIATGSLLKIEVETNQSLEELADEVARMKKANLPTQPASPGRNS